MAQIQPSWKKSMRAVLRHPAALTLAAVFNLTLAATPTGNAVYRPPPGWIALNAPVDSVLLSAGRHGKTVPQETLWEARNSKDAMDWAYIFMHEAVNGYYDRLAAVVRSRCGMQLATCPERIQKYAQTLYASYRPTPQLLAWERSRREAFIESAAQDPVLIRARKYWGIKNPRARHFMDLEDRVEAVRRVAVLYAQAFSDSEMNFVPPQDIQAEDLHPDLGGQYSWALRKVKLQVSLLTHGSFNNAMGIALHEMRHNIQHQIVDMMGGAQSRTLLEKKGFKRDAWIWGFTASMGALPHASVHDERYHASPREIDAYARMVDAERIGFGRGAAKEALFANLDWEDDAAREERARLAKKFGTPGAAHAGLRPGV